MTTRRADPRASTIHFVSLGCPKNRVDSERMVALAERQGLRLVGESRDAEVIVVNTCGFIEAAKRESIDAILEMAEHKVADRCRSLIVAGCLSQRYAKELARELPEVDHFIGTADLPRLAELLEPQRSGPEMPRLAVGAPVGLEEQDFRRRLIGPAHSAYLKIAEGCNRPCAFCSIPLMRGRLRSRSIASLVDEARALAAAQGVREVILVAQDSTVYGRDLDERPTLVGLLEALDQISELTWIRVHYAYPSAIDAPLCEALARLPRVVPYLDLPIQHVDDDVLRRMQRGYGLARLKKTLGLLRGALPDIALRTTLLVGHPGETDDAQQRLLDFLEEQAFDHLGVFCYSAEEGTPAATQSDPVPEALAQQRRDEVMALQQQISRRKLEQLVGRTLTVMVDGQSSESEYLLQGRHAGQSPEIDGTVLLTDAESALVAGQLVRARVTQAGDYDLVASLAAPDDV